MIDLIFCDLSASVLGALRTTLAAPNAALPALIRGIYYHQQDIREEMADGTAFVSPSNSFMYFDGGIDAIYSEMFPGLQDKAQARVRDFGIFTALGRPSLPVGSAMLLGVPSGNPARNVYLLAAPTMTLPSDIRGTDNVYRAFLAILRLTAKFNSSITPGVQIRRLICPGLGTGVGQMSAQESADQISRALLDVSRAALQDEVPGDFTAFVVRETE